MLDEWWALVCEFGLWGWILSAVGFIIYSFPARGVLDRKKSALWGSILVLSFIVWIAGMIKA